MAEKFDLIAIGAGMAGVTAANKCASAGWRVAIVDELPYGGTCALRGCDPKKMLRRGAEIIDAARLMRGKGVDDGGLAIRWPDMVAFKNTFTGAMPDKIENGLKKTGVYRFKGATKFASSSSVKVDGKSLESRYFMIATGAHPRALNIPGEEHVTTSDQFMDLEELPPRIVFIGGGFVSMEFAHIAARAGAEVTVCDHGDRVLKGFDPDLVEKLTQRSKAAGITIKLKTDVREIRKENGAFGVHAAAADGGRESLTADLVVHGAGRVPAIERLDLEAAGIAFEQRGISVNAHLQSVTNPRVYAAGDAAASPGAPLTPVAVFEGKVAASNMLKGNAQQPDYRGVPSAVFTIPELTRVGLLEEEARSQRLDFSVKYTDTSGWYSNIRIGETCAAAKVLIDNKTNAVIGAHLLGPESAELINFFGLAIRLGIPAKHLKRMVSAYPSVGSDIGYLV